MTITRLWQAGAELNDALVEFTTRSTSSFAPSTTVARTGTYSFRTLNNVYATQVLPSAIAQLRLGAFVNHNGAPSGDSPPLFQFRNGGTNAVELRWDDDASTMRLFIGATERDSALSAAFASIGTWMHIGVDIKLAGSGGWVYVYLDGVELVSYEGDTTGGASTIDTLVVGSDQSGNLWSTYLYLDDLYIDSTVGESVATVVPDYRFLPIIPTDNGTNSDWVGNDADSTDNYLLVDETPPDGDTTYVETDVGGAQDEYTMGDITVPEGYEISAVIPMAYAKKLNAGGSLNLKLKTRIDAGAVTSAAFVLGTDYGLIWERRTLRPDSGAWSETTVNQLEIGILAD